MDIEDTIIHLLKKYSPMPSPKIALGIGDDVSTVCLPKQDNSSFLITTDQLIENIHFKWEWCSIEDVVYKLIQRNASDILVKGGKPTLALLNLQLSHNFVRTKKNIISLAKTIGKELTKYNITLIGGDTTSSPFDGFSMTLMGSYKKMIPRYNPTIKNNDLVVTLGHIGGSSYALKKLINNENIKKNEVFYYQQPQAQWNAPEILLNFNAKASIDLSDSLFKSINILSKSNHISFNIHIDKIIPSPSLNKSNNNIEYLLFGGEDLGILFILDQKYEKQIQLLTKKLQLAIIGQVKINTKNEYFWKNNKINIKSYLNNEYSHFQV